MSTYGGKSGVSSSVPVVILGVADWDAEIKTNGHRIAEILAEYHDVHYVESLGLRAPTFSRTDFLRALRRVSAALRTTWPQVSVRPVVVHSPVIFPFHTSSLVRRLNERLLSPLRHALPDEYLLWALSPATYGLERSAVATVYHCVDFYGATPGIDAELIDKAERVLARRAALAVASSQPLATHLESVGFRTVELWENRASVDRFSGALEAQAGEHNGAVLVGNLSEYKIDLSLVLELAREIGGRFPLTIVGPVLNRSPAVDRFLQRVTELGAVVTGPIYGEQLARLVASHKVGLLPYPRTDYTKGVFPLKVFEYGAAGLQVVSTRLPALAELDYPWLHMVPHANFVAKVIQAHEIERSTAARTAQAAQLEGQRDWKSLAPKLQAVVARLLTSA